MKRVFFSDMTEGSERKNFVETKASGDWDNLKHPDLKMEFVIQNFSKILEFNPEFSREGPIQIAFAATHDAGAYQIGEDEFIEDVLISRTPKRGCHYFVATLDEARSCNSSLRRIYRCQFSNTFYVHLDDNGDIYLTRILNNDDWLDPRCISAAFKTYLAIVGGKFTNDGANWSSIKIEGMDDFCRLHYYTNNGGEKRVLLCFPASGTILDENPEDLALGKVIDKGAGYVDLITPLLCFRLKSNGELARGNYNKAAFNGGLCF